MLRRFLLTVALVFCVFGCHETDDETSLSPALLGGEGGAGQGGESGQDNPEENIKAQRENEESDKIMLNLT